MWYFLFEYNVFNFKSLQWKIYKNITLIRYSYSKGKLNYVRWKITKTGQKYDVSYGLSNTA